MKKYVFKAIMSDEKFICNPCLLEKGKKEIDSAYQDTGTCELCYKVDEVSKPKAARLLIKKNYSLIDNDFIRQLFFRTKPYNLIKV